MLIQFVVANFHSFHEPVAFTLTATGDESHPDHVLSPFEGAPGVLRAAAIYGANASGKSNLILAMQFAQELVLRGRRVGQSIRVRTFELSGGEEKEPAQFQWIFHYQGRTWSYGLAVETRRVVSEWLYATPDAAPLSNGSTPAASRKPKEELWFERKTDEDGQTKVAFGKALKGTGKVAERRLKDIESGTRAVQPFLTEAIERNVEALNPVFEWFNNVLTIIRAESEYAPLVAHVVNNADFTKFLNLKIREAGTGIQEIVSEQRELDWERDFPEVSTEDRAAMESRVELLKEDQSLLISADEISGVGSSTMLKKGEGRIIAHLLRARHRKANGGFVDFPIECESEGTQRLIHLIPALFLLQSRPVVLVVDELDRRLHTLLSRRFIEGALQYSCEKGEAKNECGQLIFTSHDTNLLDLDLLRRDEIWFIEKDESGASHLSSLAEIKVRKELRVEKGYLSGRFGAIPFFGNPRYLGLDEANLPKAELAQTA